MTTVRHLVATTLTAAAVVAAATLTTMLPGCGNKGSGKLRVGFAQEGNESGWRAANTASIREAEGPAGVELKFTDSQGQVADQVKAIQTFIQQRLDVVAFSPKEETGWDPVLRELKENHVPVICSDRNVKVSDPSLQPIYIGSDLKEEGRRAGEWLAKKMNGRAKIVQLEGNIGGSATLDRTAGFAEAIKAYPEMKIIVSRNADFARDKGKSVMESILKSDEGKPVDAVYAENDDMALGAIQALEQAGRKPGHDVTIVAVDAIKDGLQAVIDGKLNCTIECNPLLGPTIMETAKKLHAGQTVPARIISVEQLFDDPAKVKEVIGSRKY